MYESVVSGTLYHLFPENTWYRGRYPGNPVSNACGDSKERHENTIKMYRDLSFKTITTGQLADDIGGIQELIAAFV